MAVGIRILFPPLPGWVTRLFTVSRAWQGAQWDRSERGKGYSVISHEIQIQNQEPYKGRIALPIEQWRFILSPAIFLQYPSLPVSIMNSCGRLFCCAFKYGILLGNCILWWLLLWQTLVLCGYWCLIVSCHICDVFVLEFNPIADCFRWNRLVLYLFCVFCIIFQKKLPKYLHSSWKLSTFASQLRERPQQRFEITNYRSLNCKMMTS